MSDPLSSLPERPAEEALPLPLPAKAFIWLLAALLYGGSLAAWFALADRIPPDLLDSMKAEWESAAEPLPWEVEEVERTMMPDDEEQADAVAAPRPQEPVAVAPAPEKPQATRQEWPRIHVVGAIRRADGAKAMLDDAVVPVGSSRSGVTVVQVDADRVLLAYRGEQRWFSYGSFTR